MNFLWEMLAGSPFFIELIVELGLWLLYFELGLLLLLLLFKLLL